VKSHQKYQKGEALRVLVENIGSIGGATVSNNRVGEICDELRNLPLPKKITSDVDLANSLENGTIPECGINRRDIPIAKDIFGPNGNSRKYNL
jgi:hypothetical protein